MNISSLMVLPRGGGPAVAARAPGRRLARARGARVAGTQPEPRAAPDGRPARAPHGASHRRAVHADRLNILGGAAPLQNPSVQNRHSTPTADQAVAICTASVSP